VSLRSSGGEDLYLLVKEAGEEGNRGSTQVKRWGKPGGSGKKVRGEGGTRKKKGHELLLKTGLSEMRASGGGGSGLNAELGNSPITLRAGSEAGKYLSKKHEP